MRTMQLLEDLAFHAAHPAAQPLLIDTKGGVLRFTLKPGESFKEHQVPNAPCSGVVLKGNGMFVGKDEPERELDPHSLLMFDEGENHPVRALDEDLVCMGFMQDVPSTLAARGGGLLAHLAHGAAAQSRETEVVTNG